jgi:hypothetical protein
VQGSGAFLDRPFCRSVEEAVEVERLGHGGVVAAAFGDVQVAGVEDGGFDAGAEGGEVGRAVAGPTGAGIFTEGDVTDLLQGSCCVRKP